MHCLNTLLLGTFLIAVTPVLPEKKAEEKEKDIACVEGNGWHNGHDGNGNAAMCSYTLGIGGKKWKYVCESKLLWPMNLAETKTTKATSSGDYALENGLAIFSGTNEKETIQFAVNYGFPGGKVHFNGFFPDSDKTLRYHRKWFQKKDGEWKPLEELVLTVQNDAPKEDRQILSFQGDRQRWDANGKMTKEEIKQTITLKKQDVSSLYYYIEKRENPDALFDSLSYLELIVTDKKLEAVLMYGGNGFLRGFHPGLANPLPPRK